MELHAWSSHYILGSVLGDASRLSSGRLLQIQRRIDSCQGNAGWVSAGKECGGDFLRGVGASCASEG